MNFGILAIIAGIVIIASTAMAKAQPKTPPPLTGGAGTGYGIDPYGDEG